MWLEILFLALAFPAGFLIRKLTNDELKDGKKYFTILAIASILGIVIFYLWGVNYLAYTFGFMLIVSLISLRHKI